MTLRKALIEYDRLIRSIHTLKNLSQILSQVAACLS